MTVSSASPPRPRVYSYSTEPELRLKVGLMEFLASMECSTVMEASMASRFVKSADSMFTSTFVSELRLRRALTEATAEPRS